MKTLSIIMVAYNSAAELSRSLAGLPPAWRDAVLVVDNGSSDNSIDIARAQGARVLALGENTGFAHAVNAGVRAVDGEHICLLNPDTDVGVGVFEGAIGVLAGNPRACVVPTIVDDSGVSMDGCQPGYTRVKLFADMLSVNLGLRGIVHRLQARSGYHDRSWTWPMGTCLFIARHFLLELGGLDESYFMYMEDVELGHQICAADGDIIQMPDCIRHAGGQSSSVGAWQRARMLNASRVKFARRHFGTGFAWCLALLALPAIVRAPGSHPK